MANKKELLKKLLKGIETGEASAAAVVNAAKYIQHNPQTHEGSEGLAVLFARLAKTNPKVRFIRVFEDGDFAFAHNEYDFLSVRAAFEVFRFEDGFAVEHWDNIQPLKEPNPSGRSMLDGETEVRDLNLTEINRALVREAVETMFVGRNLDRLTDYFAANLIQHSPEAGDGTDALRATLEQTDGSLFHIRYDCIHRVLAEGNFVLCVSEGFKGQAHTSFYDLYRVENGLIAEHWDTVETIAPRSEWKNNNGKF
ncbi:MAG: nuclear transport factor 2 family protein [Pseudomonadota bacterium]